MRSGRGWTDRQVEQIVGSLLRAGVLLAAAVVLAGGVLYLVREGRAAADYRVFVGEEVGLRSLGGVVGEVLHLQSHGIIQVGLLLLIATPIARVALSLFAFARGRDSAYVAVTAIVLAVLVYSLL